jgi:AcrR family transcriptional regulator
MPRPQQSDKPEPRRRLDHEQVIVAAEEIVDEMGWDRLTMAVLAARVGTKGPSLYNHVASLDELKSEIQQRTIRALGRDLIGAALGRSGREGLVELAKAYRAFVHRVPNRYEGATRAPLDRMAFFAASEDANEAIRAVVRSCGMAPEQVGLAQLGIFASLHGLVMLEVNRYFDDQDLSDELFQMTITAAEALLNAIASAKVA